MTLAAGEAMGQLGYAHDWAQRYGSKHPSRADFGRGVAVLNDGIGVDALGTVVSVGEYTGTYDGTGTGTARKKTYVTFFTPGEANPWSRQFKEVTNAEVSPHGVAVSSPQIEQDLRHAFAVGWFSGQVNFDSPAGNRTATDSKDAYVARVDRDNASTDWVTVFSGDGDQVALAVATGPKCADGNDMTATETVRYYKCAQGGAAPTLLAVGGYYTTEIDFPHSSGGQNESPSIGEDAFLAVIYSDPADSLEGYVYAHLVIGSTGADRITGVAFDPVDQSIYVTGSFSSSTLNFDPHGSPVLPNAYSGGTDIFVAKYYIDGAGDLRLIWRCCTGTSGSDSGTGIAVDAGGNAYAVGWKWNTATSNRDIWVGRYPRESGCVIINGFGLDPDPGVVANWSFQYTATGDQQANGVALDGLDRVNIVGEFAGTVDFNRGFATDNRTSAGGKDIFITRLNPSGGGYLGTYVFGGAKGDMGAAIACDPVQSMRLAHAGYFGDPDAGDLTYSVDFDPNGTFSVASEGKADGYAAALVPDFPSDVQTQVTLVLDKSGSVEEPIYQAMVDAYHDAIRDPTVIPQTGKAALNVVFYGEHMEYGDQIIEEMPWTVIDSQTTADLFANRLRNLARREGQANFIDEALVLAEQSHERAAGMGLDACYHILSVSSDGRNDAEVPPPGAGRFDLQDAVFHPGGLLDSAFIDQIDGYAAKPEATRAYYLTYLAGSDIASAAFALETPATSDGFEDSLFLAYLKIMLSREAHCPGDYNGDGQVDGDDQDDFDDDWDPAVKAKKADLDWDGDWDNDDRSIFDVLEGIGCCE